jgi:methylase of polypeptide subunit release factors
VTLAPLDGLAQVTHDACAALRARFREVGFDPKLIAEADAVLPGIHKQPRLPVIRWWLEQRREPGAALARLFVHDDTLPEAVVRRALGNELFDVLHRAGVLRVEAGDVGARFLLTPTLEGVTVLSDALGVGRDAAMGPGGGTEHLGRLIPTSFRGSALDIGCGAGTLALVAAARGARRAVGVDLNPRAVEMARFNARLNGLAAEFAVGDAVEPVAADTFDLVLSQPPFVGRPPDQEERTFLFGGARGDELPLRLLGAANRVLAPGGRAIFLIQSAEREGQPLMARVRKAIGEPAPHVLVLAGNGPTPATQASVFASFDDPSFGSEYARAARRYLDHFAALDVHAFGAAIVVLTNPEPHFGSGRYALGLSLRSPPDDAGALEEFLRGLDLLEGPDDVLERSRLRLSTRVRITREPVNEAGAGAADTVVIRVASPGIGSDWAVSNAELQVLGAIDAAPRLGEALDSLIRAAPALATLRDDLRSLTRAALLHGALMRG